MQLEEFFDEAAKAAHSGRKSGQYAASIHFFRRHLDSFKRAATDLNRRGLIWHGKQLQAFAHLVEKFPDSDESSLDEFILSARDALRGIPPKSIWGDVQRSHGGSPVLDSIYSHGYGSVVVVPSPTVRHLRSGDIQRTFTTKYMGRNYFGRSSHAYEDRDGRWSGWLQLHLRGKK